MDPGCGKVAIVYHWAIESRGERGVFKDGGMLSEIFVEKNCPNSVY